MQSRYTHVSDRNFDGFHLFIIHSTKQDELITEINALPKGAGHSGLFRTILCNFKGFNGSN